MHLRRLLIVFKFCFLFSLNFTPVYAETVRENNKTKASLIDWQEWSKDSFAKAKKENKLVIMDLEAVWCHWCHVMDAKTYHNPKVASLINNNFIAIRVDQDAHPDISNRYEDYGWPATIVFDSDGNEIVKRRGYIGPKYMGWFLEAVIAEPTAEAHDNKQEIVRVGLSTTLSVKQKKLLTTRYEFIYDKKYAGWGRRQKFIHSDSIEYAMILARAGSKKHEKMAKDTFDAGRALIDPEWGGVYQYSDEADWLSPHFEKVMLIQTDSLRLYAQAYKLWGRNKDLQSALQIYTYLTRFLRSPDGVYYTSQDADLNDDVDGHAFFSLKDKQRIALGMPRVDKHIYSRENGWVLSSLLALYSATEDKRYITQAKHIADWVIKHYSVKEPGGFSREGKSNSALYLADTLAMGKGFLELYEATNERGWLAKAEAALKFIDTYFKDPQGGYSAAEIANENLLLTPVKHINSQVLMARFANKVHRYTGNKHYRNSALHTMRYLVSTDLTQQRRLLAGVLLADKEVNLSR